MFAFIVSDVAGFPKIHQLRIGCQRFYSIDPSTLSSMLWTWSHWTTIARTSKYTLFMIKIKKQLSVKPKAMMAQPPIREKWMGASILVFKEKNTCCSSGNGSLEIGWMFSNESETFFCKISSLVPWSWSTINLCLLPLNVQIYKKYAVKCGHQFDYIQAHIEHRNRLKIKNDPGCFKTLFECKCTM